MSLIMNSLGIDRLTRDERLALVQEIWDSIAAEPQPLLSESQRQELQRRVADDDAKPDELIPWDEVKSQALSRLRKS